MRHSPRPTLATLALVTALLTANGSTAFAATPTTVDQTDAAAVAHTAALSIQQQEQVLAYWTPERMAQAVPIEELASDLVDSLPADGTPRVGRPATVAPTAPEPARQDGQVSMLAVLESGAPWTGGGAVAQTTGRIFFEFQGDPSSCSGNAVTSANSSTVLTAGHCVKLQGSVHSNWVFVPGYDDGNAPFGTWTAAQTFVPPQWDATEDINYDIGAVVVNPLSGQLLTDVVGGQGVAFNQSRGVPMYAFGYPAESPYDGSELIYCSGPTFDDPLLTTDIGMNCEMTGGSSGGPWFRSFTEATGTGLQNSVNSFGYPFFPDFVFGPYFGSEAEALYDTAESA